MFLLGSIDVIEKSLNSLNLKTEDLHHIKNITSYPISVQCCVSYRNQSFFLLCKTNDWFLYETQQWAEMS